jgi:hypothetical protein
MENQPAGMWIRCGSVIGLMVASADICPTMLALGYEMACSRQLTAARFF